MDPDDPEEESDSDFDSDESGSEGERPLVNILPFVLTVMGEF